MVGADSTKCSRLVLDGNVRAGRALVLTANVVGDLLILGLLDLIYSNVSAGILNSILQNETRNSDQAIKMHAAVETYSALIVLRTLTEYLFLHQIDSCMVQ